MEFDSEFNDELFSAAAEDRHTAVDVLVCLGAEPNYFANMPSKHQFADIPYKRWIPLHYAAANGSRESANTPLRGSQRIAWRNSKPARLKCCWITVRG